MSYYGQHTTSNTRTDPEADSNSSPFPYHLTIPAPAASYNFHTTQNDLQRREAEERARRYGPAPPKLVVPPAPGLRVPPGPPPSVQQQRRPEVRFPAPMAAPRPNAAHPLYTKDWQCQYAQCRKGGKNLVCGDEKTYKEHMFKVHGLY